MRLFGNAKVAVSEQSDHVSLTRNHPMHKVLPTHIAHQRHASPAQLLVRKRAERYAVATVHDERVHAVAFHRYRRAHAFGHQLPDLLHHHGFVYDQGLAHLHDCKNRRQI